MVTPDVNVLVQAFRPEMPEHLRCRSWLRRCIKDESLALSSVVLSGLIRIVTNRRIFAEADSVEDALAFCEAILGCRSVLEIHPGSRHWEIFSRLCREGRGTANLIPDAWFAALAIEHHCTWVTLDRDFKRFSGLRIEDP